MYFRALLCILQCKNLMPLWKVDISKTSQSGGPFCWKKDVFVNHMGYKIYVIYLSSSSQSVTSETPTFVSLNS